MTEWPSSALIQRLACVVGVALLLSLSAASAAANAGDQTEVQNLLRSVEKVAIKRFAALDLDALAVEDSVADSLPGLPRRYAVPHKVLLTPGNSGDWSRQPDGSWVWRLRIRGDDAAHLNFGFSRFALPPGAALHIVATDGSHKIGPFTVEHMLPHGQLWTPVVLGEQALLHLKVPADGLEDVELELHQVNQGYRGFGVRSKACKSGSCNMDVACLAENDPWNENRRAVGAMSNGGSAFCSGSLLNNSANDRRMLFATATHCGVTSDADVASVVIYWKYESPTCRVPGSAESGAAPGPTPSTTSAGLRFLAATNSPFGGPGEPGTRSDWTLFELAKPPAGNDFDLFWAGWDRRAPTTACAAPADPTSTDGLCASIHHPSGDEKRITFVDQEMTRDNIAGAVGVHWLARWDATPPRLPNIDPLPATLPPNVTEPGSSGSALYSAARRLVGVLSGGASFCGATGDTLTDQYGGLFHAWDGLGTPTTRMRDYLDPLGANPLFIDGMGSCDAPPPPTSLMAIGSGPNEITLSWDASAGADRYRILRSIGTCPGSGFVEIDEVTGTSFVDRTVSAGTDYVYRVVSVADAGTCASRPGVCAQASTTGNCTRPPTFAGLTSAASAGTLSCGIDLAWSEATSNCPGPVDLRYNVYRSTGSQFAPAPGNQVAACLRDLSLRDIGIAPDQTNYYVVRAEDVGGATGGGQCGGVEDSNLLRLGAAAAGPYAVAFQDDVESGGDAWMVDGSGAGADFMIVESASASPSSSWFVPDPAQVSDRRLALAQGVSRQAYSSSAIASISRTASMAVCSSTVSTGA